MITANLLGKWLLIGGAGAATGTGAYYIHRSYFSNNEKLMKLADEVGLVCKGNPTETSGTVCTKKEGADVKVKVKQENTTFEATAISGGKITVYKTSDKTYHEEFKFVIEDGDISTGDTSKKLEQFETYEIKEEDGKHNLKRKNEAKDEIKKALGLPTDANCNFPTNGNNSAVECALSEEQLKKVKFEGLVEGEVSVNSGSPKLKISKVSEAPFNEGGYKFVLESTQNTKFSESLTIKKGTNTEFKLKVTSASETAPKVLTLEKAWSLEELAKKVGLKDCAETEGKKECTLGTAINVNNEGTGESNKKFTGLTKKDTAAEKKVRYEENEGDHNQGFKFFLDGDADIELQGATGTGSDDDKKILKKNGASGGTGEVSYEIKRDTTNNNTWYLTKKTTTPTAS